MAHLPIIRNILPATMEPTTDTDTQLSSEQKLLDELVVKMYFNQRNIVGFYDILEYYASIYSPTKSTVFAQILPYLFHNEHSLHLKALVKHGFLGERGRELLTVHPSKEQDAPK